MFDNKIFLFIFCLQLGATQEDKCIDWFMHFNTKFECLEYYKQLKTTTTTTIKHTTTTTLTKTEISNRVTTIELPFQPSFFPSFAPLESTTTSSSSTTTSTVPGRSTTVEIPFVPTILPPMEPTVSSTVTSTHSITYSSTVTVTHANATNSGRRNKTPWWLSLWAIMVYW